MNETGDVEGPVLDEDVLRELRGGGGLSDILAEVAGDWDEQSRTLVPSLLAALSSGELAAARQGAHSLAGSSAMLGAFRLAAACREIEAECVAGRPASPALVERMLDELARARAALEQAATPS